MFQCDCGLDPQSPERERIICDVGLEISALTLFLKWGMLLNDVIGIIFLNQRRDHHVCVNNYFLHCRTAITSVEISSIVIDERLYF